MAKMAFYRQPRRADAEGVEPPNPSRDCHLSKVVHSATLPSIQNARAATATQETVPAD